MKLKLISNIEQNIMYVLQNVQYGDSMRVLKDIEEEFKLPKELKEPNDYEEIIY